MLAGAGAAAQGRNATAAALGASASVVLNNLIDSAYGESSSRLNLKEREARKNLVTTLITGTTQALGGDAALANAAATLEMENNYLSRAQWSQRNQELSESENLLHNAAIRAKWDLIDTGQDASFRAGVIAGIPTTLYEAVEGIVDAALSPHETYLSLKSLFDSDNVLGTVSEAVKQSYIARLDKMDAEFERAGASGSFNAGLESTKLIADIVSLAASGIGVAKGGVALTNFGVKAAKQGIQSAKSVRGLATAAKQGTTAPVPQVPSKVAGVSDKLAAGNPLSKAGNITEKAIQQPKNQNKASAEASSSTSKKVSVIGGDKLTRSNHRIDDNSSAKIPTGSKGNPLIVLDGINKPTTINSREFSGHALDRMQMQGITPSTVENAIKPQNTIKGKNPGTTAYHDNKNKITVIINNETGRVITVKYGIIKQ